MTRWMNTTSSFLGVIHSVYAVNTKKQQFTCYKTLLKDLEQGPVKLLIHHKNRYPSLKRRERRHVVNRSTQGETNTEGKIHQLIFHVKLLKIGDMDLWDIV